MHAFTIRDLTRKDIQLLTQILHRHRTDDGSRKLMEGLIAAVPGQLRRSGFLSLISNSTNRFPAVAPACQLHKPLNGHIIRSIFNLVALEVGVRMNHLVARSHTFSYAQRATLQSLRELHSMWLEPEVYSGTFLETPSPRWSFQEDKCEACILGRIGENCDILIALRTVMLSRTRARKRRRRRPRITRWLEEWINCHEDMRLAMFEKSDVDGQEMKRAWKAAYRDRISHQEHLERERSRLQEEEEEATMNCAVVNAGFENNDGDDDREPADKTDEDRYDFEHEIIDHYNELVSSQYLPLDQQNMHQQTGLAPGERVSHPPGSRGTTASRKGDSEDVASMYWHPRQSTEWAKYYREGTPGEAAVGFHQESSTELSSNLFSSIWNSDAPSSQTTSISSSKSEKGQKTEEGLKYGFLKPIDRNDKRYSASVYSRDQDSAKWTASHTPTTWSMVYNRS